MKAGCMQCCCNNN